MSDWTIRHASKHDVERVLSLWNAAGSAETVTDTLEDLDAALDRAFASHEIEIVGSAALFYAHA